MQELKANSRLVFCGVGLLLHLSVVKNTFHRCFFFFFPQNRFKKINKNCIFADFVTSQRHKPQIIQGLAFSVKFDHVRMRMIYARGQAYAKDIHECEVTEMHTHTLAQSHGEHEGCV